MLGTIKIHDIQLLQPLITSMSLYFMSYFNTDQNQAKETFENKKQTNKSYSPTGI